MANFGITTADTLKEIIEKVGEDLNEKLEKYFERNNVNIHEKKDEYRLNQEIEGKIISFKLLHKGKLVFVSSYALQTNHRN